MPKKIRDKELQLELIKSPLLKKKAEEIGQKFKGGEKPPFGIWFKDTQNQAI